MSASPPYPDYMMKSVEAVERTRDKRLSEAYERLGPRKKEELLRHYHPDYKPGTKRPLKVGPNKGDLVPNEVADLLEALPLVEPGEVDLSRADFEVDILIIGAGGAGTTAALWALEEGVEPDRILMVTKLRHGDSNSIMSQGGVQAADRPEDSPVRHFLDTMAGSHFTNKPELVRALVTDGPLMIKWLEDIGVLFDKTDSGDMVELWGGGTTIRRLHSCKDYTGLEITRNLIDEAKARGIEVLEFTPAVELLTDETGSVVGALLVNLESHEYYVALAKATILATGGFGRLHIQGFPTTNHYGATADGIVIAYRAGAKLRDMDAVQYHPTGAAYPEQIVGLLLTEKLRGAGAQLVNRDGEQFVFPLEPRDVVSAAIIRECTDKGKGLVTPTGMPGVWLDTPMIEELRGRGSIERMFPAMFRVFRRFGIDMREYPVLVYPTLHYQNGGVEIDEWARTTVDGLFAAGEVTGGVHGKNRLMGNSILDYLVFGRRAGISAAKRAMSLTSVGNPTLNHVRRYVEELKSAGIETDRKSPVLLPDYRGKGVVAKSVDIL